MKKNVKNRRRIRKGKVGRMFVSASTMIAVVAIIECILLFSFTTFSWIESSSSLRISGGDADDLESMDVASNMNYQVQITADANTPADMTTYYRSVKYFRFAKASSADGETFFFPKKNNLNSSADTYRQGDTADYNISYTYFDFKLKNSTGMLKEFYFAEGSVDELFKATCNNPSITGDDKTALETAVENAMRISFSLSSASGSKSMKIYSLSGTATNAVTNKAGLVAPQAPLQASNSQYDEVNTTDPIFITNADTSESTMAIRIWLEEKALDSVTSDQLASVSVSIDMRLVSDNIVYDQIYFEDYGYSTEVGKTGLHTTETEKTMYFWAYNSNIEKYMAFPMSLTENTEHPDIPLWVTSCPVDGVFNNLTNSSDWKYKSAFFAYSSGTLPSPKTAVSDAVTEPDIKPFYRWYLPGALSIDNSGTTNALASGYDSFTSFGVTKAKASYSENEPVVGYLEFSNAVTPQKISLNDKTTAFTGENYNNPGAGVVNRKFLSSAFTQTTLSTNVELSQQTYTGTIVASDRIFYADVPDTTQYFMIYDSISTQDGGKPSFTPGKVYRYNASGVNNAKLEEYDELGVTLPEASSTVANTKRIYFFNENNWTNVYLQCFINSNYEGVANSSFGGSNAPMASYSSGSDTTFTGSVTVTTVTDSITLNNYNVFAEGSTKTANKVVTMYYDEDDALFHAYIPKSWLTNGDLKLRYDSENYYRDPTAEQTGQIYWAPAAIAAPSSDPVYSAIGYSGTTAPVASCVNSTTTGVGTWDSVRGIKISTELIDHSIHQSNKYLVSISDGNGGSYRYAMFPDTSDLLYGAYIPSGAAVSFVRIDGSNNEVIWNGGTPTANDLTYYPVSDVDDESHDLIGYYHLSVFIDATYDGRDSGLISVISGETAAQEGVSSSFTYTVNGTGASAAPTPLGDNRWYVPYNYGTTYIRYTWTPYDYADSTPDTTFVYDHYVNDGLYYVITEGY